MTGKMMRLALAGGVTILLWFPPARAGNTCVAKIKDKCTTCHYPTRICKRLGERSRRGWETTIDRMKRYGLQLSDAMEAELIGCLENLEGQERHELCQ